MGDVLGFWDVFFSFLLVSCFVGFLTQYLEFCV
jgi:hypothetical protein